MMTEKRFSPKEQADAIRRELAKGSPFQSERYRAFGDHIARTGRYIFVETEADRTFRRVTGGDCDPSKVINVSYGDPSAYPGLQPYSGVVRYLRRFLHFEDPSVWAKYEFRGDKLLIDQIRCGTSDAAKNYLEVPAHTQVYPAPGVAGALFFMIPPLIFPPSGGRPKDNVIVPKWTYLSHMGVVSLWGGEVRCCDLDSDGQINLKSLSSLIDENTRMVMLATVGNPLGVAIRHDTYDSMVRLIWEKMFEYKHPIYLVADVIYEHFRRASNGERLDPIQKALRLGYSEGIDVPVIETQSFSKMFGMPGERFGYFREMFTFHASLSQATFATELEDAMKATQIIYDLSLCPVPTLLQKPIGRLYRSIRMRLPKEEKLAPVVAVLASLRELTRLAGRGDTHTQMSEAVAEENIRRLGLDPKVWFTTSAIAKRARKLAKEELGGYKLDVATEGVERVGQQLAAAGMIQVHEIEIEKDKMDEILLASVAKHCGANLKVEFALLRAIEDAESAGLVTVAEGRGNELRSMLRDRILETVMRTWDEEKIPAEDMVGPPARNADGKEMIKFRFYKLRDVTFPEVAIRPNGQLKLYGISESTDWITFVREFNRNIRDEHAHLRIPTEDALYEQFKEERRELVHSRIDALVRGIDDMRKRGLGIRLHPSCYDSKGNLVPGRPDSFYALITIDKIESAPCQASKLISLCAECGVDKIIKATPGKVFLPPEFESEGNYIRVVTLLDSEDESDVVSEKTLKEMLKTLETVLIYLGPSEDNGGEDSNQFSFPFYTPR